MARTTKRGAAEFVTSSRTLPGGVKVTTKRLTRKNAGEWNPKAATKMATKPAKSNKVAPPRQSAGVVGGYPRKAGRSKKKGY